MSEKDCLESDNAHNQVCTRAAAYWCQTKTLCKVQTRHTVGREFSLARQAERARRQGVWSKVSEGLTVCWKWQSPCQHLVSDYRLNLCPSKNQFKEANHKMEPSSLLQSQNCHEAVKHNCHETFNSLALKHDKRINANKARKDTTVFFCSFSSFLFDPLLFCDPCLVNDWRYLQ